MKIKLIKFKNVRSTNDIAIQLIKKKKTKPTLISSEKQSKGRGTMGKKWISHSIPRCFVSLHPSRQKNCYQSIFPNLNFDPNLGQAQHPFNLTKPFQVIRNIAAI